MKTKLFLLVGFLVLVLSAWGWAQQNTKGKRTVNATPSQTQTAAKKILVAYFSHSGNTRVIAEQIHSLVGGELFEIVSVNPYPTDYNACVERAQKEQKASARPKLKVKLENAKSYDIVFIGYPNWWGSFPMPVATFLEENDFSGKTLIPFCTHEGSRLGRSVEDLTKMCPKSKILEGLAIRGRSVKTAHEDVAQWVKKIGL
jgi:flavodoxin